MSSLSQNKLDQNLSALHSDSVSLWSPAEMASRATPLGFIRLQIISGIRLCILLSWGM